MIDTRHPICADADILFSLNFKVVLKSYREGPWRRSRELSGLRDAAALAPPVLERVIGCRGLAYLTTALPAVGRVDIGVRRRGAAVPARPTALPRAFPTGAGRGNEGAFIHHPRF